MNHELDGKTIPSIINALDAKTHTAIKRPIAGVFSMSNVTKSEAFINSSIRDLMKLFDNKFNGDNHGKTFPISSWMHSCKLYLRLNSILSAADTHHSRI
jgi:hypothetical protein